MKNRILCATLFFSFALVLGGCSATNASLTADDFADEVSYESEESTDDSAALSSGATNSSETADSSETVDPSESSTAEAAPGETTHDDIPDTEVTSPISQQSAPAISIQSDEQTWYMEDGTTCLLTVHNSLISVENEGFEALDAALAEHHPGIREADYVQMIQDAEEDYNLRTEEEQAYFWGYSSTENIELMRSDSSVVSLRTFYSDYYGGAHGMYTYSGETFDTQTGRLLNLTDILTDAEGFSSQAIPYITDKLYETYGDELYPEYAEYIASSFNLDEITHWYLDAYGITIMYTPYELGPYSMGSPKVILPYSEFGSYIQPKYMASQDELIAHVDEGQDISTLLGESGPVMVESCAGQWEMAEINIVSGTERSNLGTFEYLRDCYVIKRADGRTFLLVVCDYMSDDFVTFVYEITDGVPQKCDELSATFFNQSYMSTQQLGMSVRLDVLGSYAAQTDFILQENGQLVQIGDTYKITSDYVMTTIRELPVTMDGADTTLSAGTCITIIGTNNIDQVYFKVVGSNQSGTIHYTPDDNSPWIHNINGISEYEYFDNLPYAG